MKKKMGGIIFVCAIIAFVFVPSNAHADISQGFHNVNITFVGPLFGHTVMVVDAVDGSFTDQWLELDPVNQNMLLATALTAVSLTKPAKIWVMADSHDLVGMTVQTCYSILMDFSD